MVDDSTHAPPQNPYQPALVISALLLLIGPLLIAAFFGEHSHRDRNPLLLLSGVMFATTGLIMLLGGWVGTLDHRKNMNPDRLVASWTVSGPAWAAWAPREIRAAGKRFRHFWIFFICVPIGLGLGAVADGIADDPLLWQIAGFLLAFAGVGTGLWFWLATRAMRAASCRVWLTDAALQLGTRYQTLDFAGIRVDAIELRLDPEPGALHTLETRFRVQAPRGSVERVQAYPVPDEQVETVERWMAGARERFIRR